MTTKDKLILKLSTQTRSRWKNSSWKRLQHMFYTNMDTIHETWHMVCLKYVNLHLIGAL